MKQHLTKKRKTNKQLYLPCLRASMGDWIYYISFMKMRDIAQRIDVAEAIHESQSLNDLLQRALTARVEIKKYLLTQTQRFFNSIIVGVYGGSPQWFELSIGNTDKLTKKELPDYLEGVIGYLKLSGAENLFAIDGQHRVNAITQAVKEKDSLGQEDVAVIFVSAKQDPNSRQRTRRLFSTLNRYAKPVKQRDIIALDEDDTVAIVTRMMINDYSLFSGKRINTEVRGKAIPTNDSFCITTIVSLYDILSIILRDRELSKWKDFLRVRPDDEIIEANYLKAKKYWDGLKKYFRVFEGLDNSSTPVDRLRSKNGGHLLFRPIGLQIITEVVKLFIENGLSQNDAIRRLSGIDYELSNKPWSGLLWEPIKKRMITRKENQEIAKKLLFYMAKGDLKKIKTDEDKLKEEYASAINWEGDISDLLLPSQI